MSNSGPLQVDPVLDNASTNAGLNVVSDGERISKGLNSVEGSSINQSALKESDSVQNPPVNMQGECKLFAKSTNFKVLSLYSRCCALPTFPFGFGSLCGIPYDFSPGYISFLSVEFVVNRKRPCQVQLACNCMHNNPYS